MNVVLGLSMALGGCAADSGGDEIDGSEPMQSEEELKATPGQYEVDALIKDLKAGGFGAKTLNKFVDSKTGAYIVHAPGVFPTVDYGKTTDGGKYTWDNVRLLLSTFSLDAGINRRAIPKFECENIFKVTVEDPASGKMVNIVTGSKLFIHRWQPGGVQLMNPVSKTYEDLVTYGQIPNDAAVKKQIADAKAFEKNISVKLVVPALIFNKKDAKGNPVASNPGGTNGAPITLYFGRVNGAWKLLVADIAAYSCDA